MNTLSSQRPRPSIEILIPAANSLPVDLLQQRGKAVEALAQVGRTQRQMDAHLGRERDHRSGPSKADANRAATAGSSVAPRRSTRPLRNKISTTGTGGSTTPRLSGA